MKFEKGVSGNPSGRPKGLPKALKDKEGKAAFSRIVALSKSKALEPKDQIAACKIVLAYCLGQPTQQLEHTGENNGPISVSLTIESAKHGN